MNFAHVRFAEQPPLQAAWSFFANTQATPRLSSSRANAWENLSDIDAGTCHRLQPVGPHNSPGHPLKGDENSFSYSS
jgi:hypothetical protein